MKKTGRAIVSHEAPLTGGFGAEIAASIQVNSMSINTYIYYLLFIMIFQNIFRKNVFFI